VAFSMAQVGFLVGGWLGETVGPHNISRSRPGHIRQAIEGVGLGPGCRPRGGSRHDGTLSTH
jgi:hypothetical protein